MDYPSPEVETLLETIYYDIRRLNEDLNEVSAVGDKLSYPSTNPTWKDVGQLISELDTIFQSLSEAARSDELLARYEETRGHLLRLRANARTREVRQAKMCNSMLV